jgi:hypothetical protein
MTGSSETGHLADCTAWVETRTCHRYDSPISEHSFTITGQCLCQPPETVALSGLGDLSSSCTFTASNIVVEVEAWLRYEDHYVIGFSEIRKRHKS